MFGAPPPLSFLFFSSLLIPSITYYARLGEVENKVSLESSGISQNEIEVDYIVVGAGSAGAVVANRLSKNPTHQVLVLDAGGDPTPYHSIPGLLRYIVQNPDLTFWYDVTKQKNSCGVGSCSIPRGKGLGGTSEINQMFHFRGSPNDYDHWASLVDDLAWNYENVLKYFKRSENYHGYYEFDNTKNSQSGELYIGKNEYQPSAVDNFFNGVQELGLSRWTSSYETKVGFGEIDRSIRNGSRFGTFEAFLKPIIGQRKNLKVFKYAKVIKVNLSPTPEGQRASSVEFSRHGKTYTAKARKEIILCAGAVDTPRILLQSGIGPKRALKSVGITPIHDLPAVGQNFQNHVSVSVQFSTNTTLSKSPSDITDEDFANYNLYHTGPLAQVQLTPFGFGFISSNTSSPDYPDLELFCFNGEKSPESEKETDSLNCEIMLLRPQSFGTLKLISKSPDLHPLIDPNYLSIQSERDQLIYGLEFMLKLLDTRAFKEIDAQLVLDDEANCEGLAFRSKEFWECYLRQTAHAFCHPIGTTRMGRKDDLGNSVVDSKLRVHGISNLRVVDGSIMPTSITGHPNGPIIMIGEIGSDFILNQ